MVHVRATFAFKDPPHRDGHKQKLLGTRATVNISDNTKGQVL